MNFYKVLDVFDNGLAVCPYSSKPIGGNWEQGYISVDFLNEHFGQFSTVEEMKSATKSEGLKLYFDWLRDQGILN